ncbi:MAG: thiamine-phosphate kinase [Nitrososphaerales archaeon]
MKKLSERHVIDQIQKALSIRKKGRLWNDDITVFNVGSKLIAFKCDMFVRSTDAPKQMRLWQMARKSIVSCTSDFACKGIKPLASLISLGIPKNFTRHDVSELARGFTEAEREFHVNILGGDTNHSKTLVIDCCMVGLARKIIKRSGANNGDLIITSGPFGYSSAGLRILQNRAKAKPYFIERAKNSVLMPKARLRFGLHLANYATSSMDSSDGLAITLYEISEQSRKKFIIDSLPITNGVREFAKANGYNINKLVFEGGEEYEIVATLPKHNLKKVLALARQSKCRVFVIGHVEAGSGVFIKRNIRLERIKKRGWDHLR